MKRFCIVTTMWTSINYWIKPFIQSYIDNDVDLTIVCNMGQEYANALKSEFPQIHTFSISFPRGKNIPDSVKSIKKLTSFFRQNHFDMVQYSTPNASFYTSITAKRAGIPVRLYCQWGMVYVTMTGIERIFFKQIEKLVCKLSTEIQPDSIENLEFCRKEGLYDASKSTVIWNGSAKGVDLTVFDINKKEEYAAKIKAQYGIESDAPVIGFVGRLGKEKGCNELFSAFRIIKKSYPRAKLLFVGPLEKQESIDPDNLRYFLECDDIIKPGRISNVEQYIAAMDIFVLPSYREGFGMSVVEASAMEVPVITTKYPGPSGGMIDGVTGYAIDIKSIDQIVDRITYLLKNRSKAEEIGKAGRKYVEASFDQKEYKKRYIANRMAHLHQQVVIKEH